MKEFNLSEWLQDKSRKVVTRDGREVRIVCWDRNTTYWKIIGLVTSPDGSTENPYTYDVNGNESDGYLHDHRNDLFFADEENELTEYEKGLQIIISEASHWTSDDGSISTYCQFGDKEIKKISVQILDLARKELQPEFDKEMDKMLAETDKVVYQKGQQDALKDLPKRKKYNKNNDNFPYITTNEKDGNILVYKGYYIPILEIENLPKEE